MPKYLSNVYNVGNFDKNKFIFKKTTTNQVVESKDRRIAKSMVVAMSCEIIRIDSEKETYKVQSETDIDKYYIVKFMDGTPVYCSCPDFLNRVKTNPSLVCKHARAIVLAENYGLITTESLKLKSYRDEEYDF